MTNFEKFPHKTNNNYSGTTLSAWSRQQKIAMIAGFVILGILIALSACSKQSPKKALVGISTPDTQTAGTTPAPSLTPTPAPVTPVAVEKKKTTKKRPAAIVTYSDPKSGVSFRYPRKYELASGDKIQPEVAGVGGVPMNFVQPGGESVAMVAVPAKTYKGTDFTTAFFHVNVNRSLSEQECSEFAVVDASNPDSEPMNAEKLQVGTATMEKTSNFSGDALKQSETQYYHRYESGACYEFVLGLGTAGYGTEEDVVAVNHDEVFGKLEKILETVKIQPVEQKQAAVQAETPATTASATTEQAAQQ
ncbi:MAG: hypothetical protein HY010_21445 [Acidobacteria bacterium]|nr:hypothetical protein [Acidobacteriota bacterium]